MMSIQEGIYYLSGTVILGAGLYFIGGIGPALTAIGALLVFVAIIGEFPDSEERPVGTVGIAETSEEDPR